MRKGLVVVGVVMAAACAQPETAQQMQARMSAEADSVAAVIDGIYARMQRFIAEEIPDSMAAMYAEDARMYPQGEPLVEGRDAIRAKYAEWFGMGSAEFEFQRIGLTANGPIAVERGTMTMHIMPDSGAPPGMTEMTESGKYVIVWKKVDGQWLIADDIANTDAMTPPPATAGST